MLTHFSMLTHLDQSSATPTSINQTQHVNVALRCEWTGEFICAASAMMSSSIPFERYDEEFLSLTEQVTSKLRSLDPSTSGGAPPPSSAEADVKMAHNLLLQADDLLKQMGLEARGVDDASVKRDLLGKVSRHSAPDLCTLANESLNAS